MTQEVETKMEEVMAEMKNLSQTLTMMIDSQKVSNTKMESHYQSDADFQTRMEPVLRAFENKKVVSMVIEEETKTLVFYVKSVTSFAVFLASVWYIIKQFKP